MPPAIARAVCRVLGLLMQSPDSKLLDRITINPEQCGGRPCIRGMRVRVTDILDLLAAGQTPEQVVAELPILEVDDVRAALVYASRKLNHPRLVA